MLRKVNSKIRRYSHRRNSLLRGRTGVGAFLLVNIIDKVAKFILNLPEMINDCHAVTLQVVKMDVEESE